MHEFIKIVYLFNKKPSEELIETLLLELSDHRYSTSSTDEYSIVYWGKSSGMPRTKTGSAEDVAHVWCQYPAAEVSIEFDGFELRMGPNYERDCLSTTPHIDVREHHHPFTGTGMGELDEAVVQRQRRFVEVLAAISAIVDPDWGFGLWGELSVESGTSVDECMASTSPPLYEYNLFDERVVESIGRETVCSAPAWYIEELETGDVFLVPCQPHERCTPWSDSCVAVAEHLGLSVADVD